MYEKLADEILRVMSELSVGIRNGCTENHFNLDGVYNKISTNMPKIMKFSIKDFSSKCNQIPRKMWISVWFLMANAASALRRRFIFQFSSL